MKQTFVERTFQRTLVELNKLISFSGTPTVVWRRTGEICLVGTEFCLLTGWKREELVGTGNVNGVTTSGGGRAGGGKYIFEVKHSLFCSREDEADRGREGNNSFSIRLQSLNITNLSPSTRSNQRQLRSLCNASCWDLMDDLFLVHSVSAFEGISSP